MPEQNEPQPALTKEDLQALLTEFKSGIEDDLTEKLNNAVTGVATKLRKSQEAALSGFDEKLQTTLENITPATPPEPPPADTPPNNPDAPTAASVEEMIKQAIAPYETRIQEMQNAVATERLNTKRETQRQDYLREVGSKVRDPELFLSALEARKGVEYDPEKGYGIPGQDDFGNPTFTPLSEVKVDSLLETKEFDLFKPPRAGNGLGTEPGVQPAGTPTQKPPSDPVKRFDALKTEADPIAAIVAGLEASASS